MLTQHYALETGGEVSQAVKYKLMVVSRWLLGDGDKPSLMLIGGVGNGKTSMAQTIYRSLKSLKDTALKAVAKGEGEELKPLLRIPIPMVVKAIKITTRAADNPFVIEDLKQEKFLAIDDLGVEPTEVMNFGSRYQPITDLIYGRYDKKLPTIYTSNLDWGDILAKYGPRVVDRLKEDCLIVDYTDKSYRTGVDYANIK